VVGSLRVEEVHIVAGIWVGCSAAAEDFRFVDSANVASAAAAAVDIAVLDAIEIESLADPPGHEAKAVFVVLGHCSAVFLEPAWLLHHLKGLD
jgi:hypothetical protein